MPNYFDVNPGLKCINVIVVVLLTNFCLRKTRNVTSHLDVDPVLDCTHTGLGSNMNRTLAERSAALYWEFFTDLLVVLRRTVVESRVPDWHGEDTSL
jgi:hypothetical protein